MKWRIFDRGRELTVADEEVCGIYGGRWDGALLHAAKAKCHRAAVGYEGNLSPSHEEYLIARRGRQLFLNMVDAPIPIFKGELFVAALDFIDEHIEQGPVAVHCNQGYSRAPAIALLWLAKRARVIADTDYETAVRELSALVPAGNYQPGQGIKQYLERHWPELR